MVDQKMNFIEIEKMKKPFMTNLWKIKQQYLKMLKISCIILVCVICNASAAILKNKLSKPDFMHSVPVFVSCNLIFWVSLLKTQKFTLPSLKLSSATGLLIFYYVMLWVCVKNASPFEISFFAPTKVLFTFLIMRILIHRKFFKTQYFGIFLIIFGLMLAVFFGKTTESVGKSRLFSMFNVVSCTTCGLFFAIVNCMAEQFLRSPEYTFWELAFSSSIVTLPISILFCLFQKINNNLTFIQLINQPNIILIILCDWLEASSKAVLLYHFEPMYRAFATSGSSCLIAIIDSILHRNSGIKTITIISFIIANIGFLIYECHNLKHFLRKRNPKDALDVN